MHDLTGLEVVQARDPVGFMRFYTFKELPLKPDPPSNWDLRVIGTWLLLEVLQYY